MTLYLELKEYIHTYQLSHTKIEIISFNQLGNIILNCVKSIWLQSQHTLIKKTTNTSDEIKYKMNSKNHESL